MLISLLMAGLVLALLVLAAAARIWTSVLPMRVKVPLATYRASPVAPLTDSTAPRTPARAMVVLGSGGHTTEMLALIRRLDRAHYAPITFVVAATDATSEEKTRIDWRPRDGVDSFVVIPRSREVRVCCPRACHIHSTCSRSGLTQSVVQQVGQSWSSSVWTTLRAFVTCVSTVYTHQPHVVLCNGPGTRSLRAPSRQRSFHEKLIRARIVAWHWPHRHVHPNRGGRAALPVPRPVPSSRRPRKGRVLRELCARAQPLALRAPALLRGRRVRSALAAAPDAVPADAPPRRHLLRMRTDLWRNSEVAKSFSTNTGNGFLTVTHTFQSG